MGLLVIADPIAKSRLASEVAQGEERSVHIAGEKIASARALRVDF